MRVEIKPELLHWACDRAGVALEDVAERIPQLPAGTYLGACGGMRLHGVVSNRWKREVAGFPIVGNQWRSDFQLLELSDRRGFCYDAVCFDR